MSMRAAVSFGFLLACSLCASMTLGAAPASSAMEADARQPFWLAAAGEDNDGNGGIEVIRGSSNSHGSGKNTSSSGLSGSSGGRASRQPASERKSAASGRNVVMYGAAWCGYCRTARAYFERHQIPYTEYDVDKSARGHQEYEELGGGGVPIIVVGDASMRGFSASEFASLYYDGR